ncbi:MAG: CCA tRNA nucleotidyltransferase [Thermoplasmatota archaeon]
MVKGGLGSRELSENIREAVLEAVSPTDEERTTLKEVCDKLLERVRGVIDDLGLKRVEPMLAGSAAKGTMLKEPDIDVFAVFPEATPQEVLEEMGLRIGTMTLDDPRKKYTQHPYITGTFLGWNCDIVPCLAITKGSRVSTAVDRTPHHTRYVNSRMTGTQKEEVLLLKSFLKGIGAYGAEDTVQGCSGYLVELLVLGFGNFDGVINWFAGMDLDIHSSGGYEEIAAPNHEAGKKWTVLFDELPLMDEVPLPPMEYAKMFAQDPLVVVDPVDSRRNVASPVSVQTLSYISRASREILSDQGLSFFHPFSRRPYRGPSSGEAVRAEGETLFMLDLPEGDPGMVITQLRRSIRKLAEGMTRAGFEGVTARFLLVFPEGHDIDLSYLRSRYAWTMPNGGPSITVYLVTVPEVLPREYVHWGPPIDNPRFSDFKRKWGGRVEVDEEEGRGYVIQKREAVDPSSIALEVWKGSTHGSSFGDPEPVPIDDRAPASCFLQVFRDGFDPWRSKA